MQRPQMGKFSSEFDDKLPPLEKLDIVRPGVQIATTMDGDIVPIIWDSGSWVCMRVVYGDHK